MSTLAISKPKLTRNESARLNGAKSKGPTTEDGKQISSRNRITHGLYSSNVLLPTENREEFLQHWQTQFDAYAPTDGAEANIVKRIVILDWEHDRLLQLESKLLGEGRDSQLETLAKFSKLKRAVERSISRTTKDLYEYRKQTDPNGKPKLNFAPDLHFLTTNSKLTETNPRDAKPEIDGNEPKTTNPEKGRMEERVSDEKSAETNPTPDQIKKGRNEPKELQHGEASPNSLGTNPRSETDNERNESDETTPKMTGTNPTQAPERFDLATVTPAEMVLITNRIENQVKALRRKPTKSDLARIYKQVAPQVLAKTRSANRQKINETNPTPSGMKAVRKHFSHSAATV